ncbi:MAG: NADP-dependent malic enzyme [Fusobacteria bacterium]|nr:NADP-dependent malic enzyme [Fusobacteriota bacterium]
MSDIREEALRLHKEGKGKLEINLKFPLNTKEDLSLLYTPGVAEPCKEIDKDREKVYDYTIKGNCIAVVTDGTAVLGLGDIGPYAGLPVMEGKAALFKRFANIDAIPICIDSKDTEDIIKTVKLIAPSFGGINLEDIAAPKCFEIERRLIEELDIPVFHDDQHGTGIVVLSGIINGLKLVKKNIKDVKIVINGGGAAGTSIAKHIINYGAKNVIVCDMKGAISSDDPNTFVGQHHGELSKITNPNKEKGLLIDIIKGADIFIGVSKAGMLTGEMVETMNKDSIVFAMANPVPEIMPDIAKKHGARIVGSGRSDFPNQINNILAFPGIFRGALDARARDITEEMKISASIAIASIIKENELNEDYVIPSAFDERVVIKVGEAVKNAHKLK